MDNENKEELLISHINGIISTLNDTGNISDGYHSFDELYYHRAVLFGVICKMFKDLSWKSKRHHDGSMYANNFIVGIDTPMGQYSYHYSLDLWYMFDAKELENAPEYDGHQPSDVIRLFSLFNKDWR